MEMPVLAAFSALAVAVPPADEARWEKAVAIEVLGSEQYDGYEVRFEAARGRGTSPVWRAVRRSVDGQVTGETQCDAIETAAQRLADLPALQMRTWYTTPFPDRWPIGPTLKDGFALRISLRAIAADYSTVDVTLDGGEGPYFFWAYQTIGELEPCWP